MAHCEQYGLVCVCVHVRVWMGVEEHGEVGLQLPGADTLEA